MFKSISIPQNCLLLVIARGRDMLRISAGSTAETQGRAPCLPHVPHNSTGKQDPNCRISALLCCLRQMVQLQATMGFISKHQKGSVTSDTVFELSLLKEKPFKSLCQGVSISNQVPIESSFASFLRKSCFLQISYQEFKVMAESLRFQPWGIPSWEAPCRHLSSHSPHTGRTVHWAAPTEGSDTGRVTITCVKVQDVTLEPSFSA